MSLSYGVLAIVPETHEWLEAEGYQIPKAASRLPTLDELFGVLERLYPSKIRQEQVSGNLLDIVIGVADSSPYAEILGSTEPDGFDFQFLDSEYVPMIEILKQLAVTCGPLIIYEHAAVTPQIVDAKTNVQKAIEDWNQRYMDKRADIFGE